MSSCYDVTSLVILFFFFPFFFGEEATFNTNHQNVVYRCAQTIYSYLIHLNFFFFLHTSFFPKQAVSDICIFSLFQMMMLGLKMEHQLQNRKFLRQQNLMKFLVLSIQVFLSFLNMEKPVSQREGLKEREIPLGRNNIYVMNVENTSVKGQPLFSIKESTVGRNLMDVLSVGRHSAEVPSLYNIRESILEKNLTNVLNAEKPLARILGLLIIKESILGRNLMNVFSVGNLIVKAQIFLDIREDTMQKNF